MPSIIDIYSSSIYEIYNPHIILRVWEVSKDLDALLQKHDAHEWAFITPYNPYPETLTDKQNMTRLLELQMMTVQYKSYFWEWRGDEDHPCTPERSILILGISRKEAEVIGNHFHQKAILAGVRGGPVELVVLFD